MLPTPMTSDWKGSAPADWERTSPQLRAVDQLLATPTTSEATGAGNGPNKTGGNNLRTQVAMLPTPRATRGGSATETVALLPTPVAQPSGNTPENHLRKKPGRQRVTDLSIIAENDLFATGGKLLPTPKAGDGEMHTPSTSGRPVEKSTHLGTIAMLQDGHLEHRREKLLPTPNTMDMLPAREGEAMERQLRRGEGSNAPRRSSMGNLREDIMLTVDPDLFTENRVLPTPRATDGTNGGPNQRGSKVTSCSQVQFTPPIGVRMRTQSAGGNRSWAARHRHLQSSRPKVSTG